MKGFLLYFILFTTFCFSQEAEHYKTKEFDVAIFPETYKELLPEKRFTPTQENIIEAELALHTKLEKLNYLLTHQSDSPVIHKNLNKYLRQYFGYIDENGNRILIINCFWKNIDKMAKKLWLKDRITVADGGSFYWNVKYNLDTGELFDLKVNGNE
ncbi:hypothetical protein [Flavobacterium sp.]|uniref:hypothetical protein n=1 Tax=Flavobacterium sp. TaxID=239 RepID=UPI003A8F399E